MLRTKVNDPEDTDMDKFVWFYELEHTGNFNFKTFYALVHRWFKFEGWKHWQDGGDKWEDLFWVHEQANGSTDYFMYWRVVFDVNKYIRYFCKFDFQLLGVKKAEDVFQGKKVKTESLNLTLRVWWFVQYDVKNLWKRSKIYPLRKIFYKYAYKQTRDDHREKLKIISLRLYEIMKQYFGMATLDSAKRRTFFPEAGHKWDRAKPDPKDFEWIDRKPDPDI